MFTTCLIIIHSDFLFILQVHSASTLHVYITNPCCHSSWRKSCDVIFKINPANTNDIHLIGRIVQSSKTKRNEFNPLVRKKEVIDNTTEFAAFLE